MRRDKKKFSIPLRRIRVISYAFISIEKTRSFFRMYIKCGPLQERCFSYFLNENRHMENRHCVFASRAEYSASVFVEMNERQ